ncbi:DeoR/GlpR family DNA-binding transcription regulator [Proteiniphilum sp. X52]|uniref:DeoR/GlpR family DNA-binding transcription regulator n=1 Tax=Proteiniphilum sp. X52 TaxID=2382159 RepID=UPI000F0A76C7|nr:DeoR/GlpR family DNA-binding transcription regulator [Proteiniphilum sp. X52]RNC66151.1 DeoR/GlpR transcriptional regulator [Proteiniphilum sp. X52]
MLSIAERHKYIIDTLNKEGFVKVIDIANALNITTVTARKDLKQLEEKGLLYRTHGSASPANPHIGDRTVTEKEKIRIIEKNSIGMAAARLIEENDSVIMNSGSTICSFAEQIAPQTPLRVVTSSLKVSLILGEKENINILQLGGRYRTRSMSVIGSYTLSLLEKITCSKLFLGVDGVDTEFGVTTSNLEEAELNIAMMNASLKTIVLCDSSKFGRKGFGKICNIDKIDTIVTDSGIPESMKEVLEEQGIELIIA